MEDPITDLIAFMQHWHSASREDATKEAEALLKWMVDRGWIFDEVGE